ncbi:MAG: sterol desaturase family protein [Actinomycetota bacterium]|nr:sterol desaturase family protein [Actinomycetota bacterium]
MTGENQGGYLPPDPVVPPPLYAWPPLPQRTVRWLLTDFLFPLGIPAIGLAILVWQFLTPNPESLMTFSPEWIGLVWFRNAGLMVLVAGGLHWWLYVRRSQGQEYKYVDRWPATNSAKFLWRHQVRDNMFWSLASGVTIWSLYEALTLWAWASGRIPRVTWGEAPLYLVLMYLGFYFMSSVHFYLIHRLLHWGPLYHAAHHLHHRNVNTGPWTGISMHPVEHVLYFSIFLLWWVVPVHPTVIILTGLYKGLEPAVSHSGFDRVALTGRTPVSAGDLFHHLHHRHFEVNYGNTLVPIDKATDTWHDSTDEAQEGLRHRRRGYQR